VVEDDDASAQALRLILRRYGWQVEVASTISAANAYLDAHTPDVILLDLMLPDGEGASILRRVRERGLASKVTVTTASSDPTGSTASARSAPTRC
jgi:two-component system OmpR family response regulator